MESFAELMNPLVDEDIPLLKELLSFDMQCPASCTFVRGQFGQLIFSVPPSPMHWSRQTEWPWVIKNADLRPHHTVLDVGSGWSVLKYALAKRAWQVTCVDIDSAFVKKSEEASRHFPYRNIDFAVADAKKLPYEDNTFDRVFCCSVVEHMPEGYLQAVKECIRICKPGGRCLFTFDVVVNGNAGNGNNFYLTITDASHILVELGISMTVGDTAIGARMEDEGVEILCVLACHIKPEAT